MKNNNNSELIYNRKYVTTEKKIFKKRMLSMFLHTRNIDWLIEWLVGALEVPPEI